MVRHFQRQSSTLPMGGHERCLMRVADVIAEITPDLSASESAGLTVKKDTIVTITQGDKNSDHRVVCSIFIAHTTAVVRLHLRLNCAAPLHVPLVQS